MRRLIAAVVLWCGALAAAPPAEPGFWDRFRSALEDNLGRPYVWGATGLKSYDCSGFVWRVIYDSGILMKRTTARKLYLSLPAVSKLEQWSFGNIVFFDNLAHCGIVNSRSDFYHAESSKGTNLSRFDPYWRPKVCGVRRLAQ
ncbi:MAG: NlpC/P60 family protein [Bryobacteraceae bacterium]|jgi:peptidoglycan endopeptidase LytE